MTDGFYQNTVSLIETIEECLEKHRLLPCLILLYTGIDVMASLERRPEEGTKAAFMRWVDGYLLKVRPLPCTSTEMYAARCGILHTFSADSDLSRRGKARELLYAWGVAQPETLAQAASALGRDNVVVVHIRDLLDAFRHGIADYVQELEADVRRQDTVAQRAGLWFVNMEFNLVQQFIELDEKGRDS
jgi:hypothetical protein